MKIITDNGEYMLHYEDDNIIHADMPRVSVMLTNIQGGQKVVLEVEFWELSSMARYLCEHLRCGICQKPLWTRDDDRWNYQSGYMCSDCARESDHPAARMHRDIQRMVEADEYTGTPDDEEEREP
jgi:hypothetical protein